MELIGMFVIVLLALLIASIWFATFVLWKRIQQMKQFQQKMEQDEKNEGGESHIMVPSPPIMRLGVKPPQGKPHEKIMMLEDELDKLYEEREYHREKLPSEEWEKRENKIISEMVDFFIKEIDHKLIYESKSQISGSH